MKFSISKLVLVSISLFAIAGCQTMPYQPYARDVKKRPQAGGVIALKMNYRDEDRSKADQMMTANCGSNQVKVLEEGETVVGQTTNMSSSEGENYGNKTQVGTFMGMPVTSGSDTQRNANSTATTTNLKEWQISYECVATAPTTGTGSAASANSTGKTTSGKSAAKGSKEKSATKVQ